MGRKADPLRVVEAGYEWIADEREWLDRVVEAAAPFGIGTGVAAYAVSLAGKPDVTAWSSQQAPASFERELTTFTRALAPSVAREVYAPTEFVGNANHRVRRLAREKGTTV